MSGKMHPKKNSAAVSAATTLDMEKSGTQLTIHARSEALNLNVPPPALISEYCKDYPNAAEVFFKLAQEEANYRRCMDEKIVASRLGDSRLGLWFGLIVSLVCLGVAAMAVVYEQPWVAGFLGSGSLASLAGAFIRGHRNNNNYK